MTTNDNENYVRLRNSINRLYPEGLDSRELDEATRNLINFGKILLEIKASVELESLNE